MSEKKDDDDGPMALVCVNCGKFVQSVYIEYSPGNIRLSNCANCGGIVDKYVEYEIMIVIIDVILHKYEAYRHAFFNYPRLNRLSWKALIWKATLCSLLLDTWRWTSLGNEHVKVIEWDSPARFFITAGKVVAQVGFLNCVYLFAVMVTLNLLSKTEYDIKSKYKDVFLAVLLSSHFKFFVFAMMVCSAYGAEASIVDQLLHTFYPTLVFPLELGQLIVFLSIARVFEVWEFSFLMGLMVDLLVLTSNLVALEVMLNASRFHAAMAVISGAVSKCLMVVLFRYSW